MNITELARRLKITPQELLDALPLLGFDIGRRAIKINFQTANRIIREWPVLKQKLENLRSSAALDKNSSVAVSAGEKKTVIIKTRLTVREFAAAAERPVNVVLKELIKNGVFASINEMIDFDTAWLIGSDLGLEVKKDESATGPAEENGLAMGTIIAEEKAIDLVARPPVVVVMGHVDHGKTKLLDTIRRANVIDSEAGGITQHIGAYQIVRNGREITFIDTPGHEAFTAMRSRGAKVADIAILVVAADDGVKPQTVEAYRIIAAAGLPFLVAINKIDKPEANIDKTKQELASQLNVASEDWGGKIICSPVSAKSGQGIEALIDNILLIADLEGEKIKANPHASAAGTVIEAHVDKGAGPVATILVQNGTLRVGDSLCVRGRAFGRVRSLFDFRGQAVKEAGLSAPVMVIGLRFLPEVGDLVMVGAGERIKEKRLAPSNQTRRPEKKPSGEADGQVATLAVIIKGDVFGSVEAIEESLEKINTDIARVNVIHRGLGNISDGDLKKAEAAGALIVGFNVKVPTVLENVIREKNINVKLYRIIYDLINDIRAVLESLIAPENKRVALGQGKVLAVFRTDKNSQIIGVRLTQGRVERDSEAEVVRQQEKIGHSKIIRVQSGKQDVPAAESPSECGLQVESRSPVAIGDGLEFFREETITRKLD